LRKRHSDTRAAFNSRWANASLEMRRERCSFTLAHRDWKPFSQDDYVTRHIVICGHSRLDSSSPHTRGDVGNLPGPCSVSNRVLTRIKVFSPIGTPVPRTVAHSNV